MFSWRNVSLLAVIGVVSCAGPAVLGRATGRLPDGVVLRVRRMVAPANAISRFADFGGNDAIAGAARYYYDPAAHTYSGYEIHVRPFVNGQYTVMLEALGMPLEELPRGLQGYRAVPMPTLPHPRILHQNETLDIDLQVTAAGDRLFDRIELN